jgi:phage terminase large subunit
MKLIISDSFFPLLENKSRYLVLCGGAGSGKSEFAARKLLYRCLLEGNHRFLILRKVRSRVRESVLEVMLRILRENEVAFDFNKTERTITFFNQEAKKNELLFDGLDDPEKIKSIKGLTGIWLEEATEFSRDDFLQIDLRLREPGPHYKQIILSFNPIEAEAPWLKEIFFDKQKLDAFVHRSTVEDNPIKELRTEYLKQLDALTDEVSRKIYRLGEWAMAKGVIFPNWDVVQLPRIKFDETFYGGDFGYSVDPAAIARIYRKADEFWLEEVLYRRGLTNADIASELKIADIKHNDIIYWDAAEPKSIQELCNAGILALPSDKGADSVRAGIDFLRSKKIHVVAGSTNLIREKNTYHWQEDKRGEPINKPVKFDDHLMDAVRYAIFTHMKQAGVALGTLPYDVRPD